MTKTKPTKVVKRKKEVVKKKSVKRQEKTVPVDYRYSPLSSNLRVLCTNDEDLILVDRVTRCLYVLVRTVEGYQLQIIGV